MIKELERSRGLSVFGRQMTVGEDKSGDMLLSISGYNWLLWQSVADWRSHTLVGTPKLKCVGSYVKSLYS